MAETATPKGKKNKALYIGLGVLALGGLIYFLMRKKGSSTSVTINVANYSASDYEPLTDAQIKAKIDEVNGLVNQLGVDETIKQLQSQIDSYMTDGSPESLAYASLLEDIIADLENQSRSTTNAVAPNDMTMGMSTSMGTSPDMTMGMGTSMGSSPNMTMGMGVPLTPTLTPSSIDVTKYPLLTSSQIGNEIGNANSLVSSKGVAGAIADLNGRTGALLSSTNPLDQQLGLLLNEIIRLLGGIPLNTTLAPTRAIGGTTTTPSTNDLTAFVDPATKPLVTPAPLPSTISTSPTPTPISVTPNPTPIIATPTIPQLTTGLFDIANYPGVTQALIDSKVGEINASAMSNGVSPTVQSLLANATQLDASSNATDRATGKLIYDMAVTLDILNNPANASKYTIKDANYWRNLMISRYNLTSATPDINMFTRQLYLYWARTQIDFPEPIQSQYDAQPYATAKTNYLKNLVSLNGAINLLNNVIWRLTPLGNLIAASPSVRS